MTTMIICPYCKAVHVPNTVFCSECGCYLLPGPEPKTTPLDEDDDPLIEVENGRVRPEVKPSISDQARAALLRLKIGTNRHREVEVTLDKPIQVGRVDPASNIFPEIDLTEDGDLAKSVSRRHAQFIREGNMVTVEDLASANGTYVNGRRLSPYLPEPLKDQDLLHFGQLPAEVKILEMSL